MANRINVALTPDLHAKLTTIKKKTGLPVTALLRQAVYAYVQEFRRQERIATGR
jgi:hypothetical protein